jgi:hypothetical protein
MVQAWVIVGLAIAAVAVSTLGAAFSVVGLGKLFTGAVVAVWLMAGALEFAKFVTAAYLHQVWHRMNKIFRFYLVLCVITLSCITSMGVFGFLSDAYLASSSTLEAENIKLAKLQNEQLHNNQESERITRGVDEIPDSRISKKLAARKDAEPMIRELKDKNTQIEAEIEQAKLKVLEVKQKVGPLIYIAKAFNMNIDDVVKYLIMVFVGVFDPLAICLVVAFSDAIKKRRSAAGTSEEDLESADEEPATLRMRFAEDGEVPAEDKNKEAI